MDIWVRIDTNEGNFDNPDKPTMSEMDDVLRNPGNYAITEFYLNEDIVVEAVIQD